MGDGGYGKRRRGSSLLQHDLGEGGGGAKGDRNKGQSCLVSSLTSNSGTSRKKTTGKTVIGILGEPVTLSLEFPASEETKNVVWVFNTSVISQEPKGAATVDPHRHKSKSSEERRLRISDQDSSLKISQLKMEDTGPYHAYVCSETSRGPSVRHFTLLVYREYPSPASSVSPPAKMHS